MQIVFPVQVLLYLRRCTTLDALDAFRELGQALVQRQVLLDVVVDQKLSSKRLSQYPAVIVPKAIVLSDEQFAMLREYSAGGGLLLRHGPVGSLSALGQPRRDTNIKNAIDVMGELATIAADAIAKRLRDNGATVIDCPWTVRATANAQPGRVVLHLVNYDREEAPVKGVAGPTLERPKAVTDIAVRLRMPRGQRANSVTLVSPDHDKPTTLEFESHNEQVTFTVPRIEVYGVIAIGK